MTKLRENDSKGDRPFDKETRVEPCQRRYRWVMLALLWFLYFVLMLVTRSTAPLVTPILADLKISYSQMGIILGSSALGYIVVAAMAGAVIDKWGIRRSLLTGMIVIGLSAVLRYFATGFLTMFAFVALLGLGGPMISIGCPKTISLWFRGRSRSTAVGVYMNGAWIGGLVAYSMTNSLVMPLTGWSWRLTFVYYGLVALAVALLWWLFARDIEFTAAVSRFNIFTVFTDLVSIRNVQLILIMGFLDFAINHGFSNWLPKILEAGGLTPATAGFRASIHLLVSVPAVLVLPRLFVSFLRGRTIALMFLATAIALLIIGAESNSLLIPALVLYGLSYCSITPILFLILMEIPEIGSRYIGSAAGMFFCVAQIGGFAGPFIVGALKGLTGTFFAGTCFLAALSIAASVMALLLRV